MMITIKQATLKEKQILKEFQKLMALETENLELNEEDLDKGLYEILINEHRGKYFVAVDKDIVIGCLMITPEWSDWRNGIVWWIQSVFVIQSYRRKGVYKLLYTHIQEWVMRHQEYKGIRLYVEKDNRIAQQVYSTLGMNGEHYKLYEWMKD